MLKPNLTVSLMNGNNENNFDWEIIRNAISSTNKATFFTFFGLFSSFQLTGGQNNNNSGNNTNVNNNNNKR